jgi:hypothetical protein
MLIIIFLNYTHLLLNIFDEAKKDSGPLNNGLIVHIQRYVREDRPL